LGDSKKDNKQDNGVEIHSWEEDMKIHHPDGNVEDFKWDSEV